MKIFGWMQNKLTGKQTTKKPTPIGTCITNKNSYENKEEFSDWPHALLAIGTFGNKNVNEDLKVKHDSDLHEEENSSSLEDQLDFTPEEVGKLQKELTKLLSRKPIEQTESQRRNGNNLPLDKFLNCPSSLEVDRTICNTNEDDLEVDKEIIADLRRSISVVLGRGKDISFDSNNTQIKKKSIAFLLKKMFVCSSGFAPTPSFRDQMQLPESRMEKLLRAILHKKIHRTSSGSKAMTKKYLQENKHFSEKEREEQTEERENHGSNKWDKTDSEYIVLEI